MAVTSGVAQNLGFENLVDVTNSIGNSISTQRGAFHNRAALVFPISYTFKFRGSTVGYIEFGTGSLELYDSGGFALGSISCGLSNDMSTQVYWKNTSTYTVIKVVELTGCTDVVLYTGSILQVKRYGMSSWSNTYYVNAYNLDWTWTLSQEVSIGQSVVISFTNTTPTVYVNSYESGISLSSKAINYICVKGTKQLAYGDNTNLSTYDVPFVIPVYNNGLLTTSNGNRLFIRQGGGHKNIPYGATVPTGKLQRTIGVSVSNSTRYLQPFYSATTGGEFYEHTQMSWRSNNVSDPSYNWDTYPTIFNHQSSYGFRAIIWLSACTFNFRGTSWGIRRWTGSSLSTSGGFNITFPNNYNLYDDFVVCADGSYNWSGFALVPNFNVSGSGVSYSWSFYSNRIRLRQTTGRIML